MSIREYAMECEHTSGEVWTPVGLYAIDGTNDRIVRCRDCGKHGEDSRGNLTCRLFEDFVHSTEPDGFCDRAEVMDDGD